MVNTKRADVIVQKIQDILLGAKDTFDPPMADVYYGDQELIPEYPAIAVESGGKRRQIIATKTFDTTLIVTIYVYHGKVQSSTITRKQTDALAEQVEDLLHDNYTMDGLVVFGYVTRTDPGVALRSDVMLRTTRMIWEGTSRERF